MDIKKFAKHSALLTACTVAALAASACGTYGVTTHYLESQEVVQGPDGQNYIVTKTEGIQSNYKEVIAVETARSNNFVNITNAVGRQVNDFHETTMRFGMPFLASFFGNFFQFKSNETYYKTAKSMNQTNVDANVKMFNTAVKAATPAPKHHPHNGGSSGKSGMSEDDFIDNWRSGRTSYNNGKSHCIPEGTNGVHNSYNSVKDKLDNMYKTPFSVLQRREINGLEIFEFVEQNVRC